MTRKFTAWFASGTILLSLLVLLKESCNLATPPTSNSIIEAQPLANPQRLCKQNPYTLQPSLGEIAEKMDSWLDRELDVERHMVAMGEAHTHERFQVFEQMGICNETCVGGPCSSDQSKILCGLDTLKAPCVVYSIGGNNQWEFEKEILKRNPECEIHTFDCTGKKSRFKVPENVHFHHVCLGVKNLPAPSNPPDTDEATVVGEMWTLQKMQTVLKHSRIDLLKMDIEGYEWPLLASWPELFDIRSRETLLPMQIAIEIHYQTQMAELATDALHDFKHNTDLVRLQSHLLKMGYATVINDPNPRCLHCVELTLVRIRCPSDPAISMDKM